MLISETARKVEVLQKLSRIIYLQTLHSLKMGMSEQDIASAIHSSFLSKGISSFWYDIPISVFISEKRFLSMGDKDYRIKSPSTNALLKVGDVVHIDLDPMDSDGNWGDFSATCVFKPKSANDSEKVKFLQFIRDIQKEGIKQLTSKTKAGEVAKWYLNKFREKNITLLDVRNTVGHSIHSGAKKYPDGKDKRLFLEVSSGTPLGEGIYAIEPGGYSKNNLTHEVVVGRFEDCVYVPLKGKPIILGNQEDLPLFV